jgi:hypothetical protein
MEKLNVNKGIESAVCCWPTHVVGGEHGLINYIVTKAKCRHLKN